MQADRTLKVAARGDREIVMTRAFDAPRALVFEAWTKPELLKKWLGVFGGWSLAVCEIDLRPGGRARYVWRGPAGEEMGMTNTFREVAAPERIVATEKFDQAWYEGEAVGTVEFVEAGGVTTVTQTMVYATKETRDAVLKSPMETGVAASYDALAAYLATVA